MKATLKLLRLVPLTVAAAAFSLSSHAAFTTIDFEDVAVPTGTSLVTGDVNSGGYRFNSRPNHSHLVNNDPTTISFNDSTWLGFDDELGNHRVTMTRIGGGLFDLLTVDFTEFINLNSANRIRVRGSGGQDVTINLDNIADGSGALNDFQTETFNWSNLSWVRFFARGNSTTTPGDDAWWGFDNLQVHVPEPATLGMIGISLLGLGLTKRRKR